MRFPLSLSVLALFFSTGISLAQQTNQDPYQLIQDKLMRTKTAMSANGTPLVSGMISHGNHAPSGVFATNLGSEELKHESFLFHGDSLDGFDFEKNKQEAFAGGFKLLSEFKAVMRRNQIDYVKKKYNLTILPAYEFLNANSNKIPGNAQTLASLCGNIDFEDGNFGGWTISSGINQNSNSTLTILGAGVTSTNQNIYSCNDVNLLTSAYGTDIMGIPGVDPNGGSTSVRLGGFSINVSDGYGFGCSGAYWAYQSYSNGEKIENTVLVSAANALLSYDYAVVLNDGGHTSGNQPYFHVFVTDLSGNILSSCTQYYVQAPAGLPPPGFAFSGYYNPYDNSALYYKNWTSNSINLTPYIGQNVKISFVAAGCTAGAHMGYAYVDAVCGPLDIDISNAAPCAGTSVILTAPAVQGGLYLWTGPGVTGLTTQTVSVNTNATYTCAITPPQGAACAYTVTRNVSFTPLPIANAGPTKSITCASTTTVLSGSGGGTYSWTGPGIVSGGSTSAPTVNAGGNYTLVVASSGCNSLPVSVSVVVNTTAPGASTLTANTINCTTLTSNAAVTATAGMNYSWSGPGIVSGGTTSSALVNVPGNYVVTVTNPVNSCQSTGNVNVPTNTIPPGASTLTANAINCTTLTSNAAVTATAGMNYSWSGPGVVSGGTTSSALVNVPGNYVVTVTNPANGCQSTGNVNVPTNTTPPGASTLTANTINCATLTSNAAVTATAGMNYSWSGPGIVSGGTTSSALVNVPGNYVVTVTNPANGCQSTGNVSVPVNTTQPSPAISSPTVLNCSNTSMNLTGSPLSGVTYTWTGPGIVSGANTASPLINLGGTYNLNVTSTANGCSSGTSIAIAASNTSISILPSTSGSVTCSNNTISLSTINQAGQNYTWTAPSGASISGSPNSAATTGSNSGTYSVTVYNTTNGCSQVGTIAANVNTAAAVPNVSTSGTVTCASNAVNLNSSTSGVTYTWVAPAGSSISGSPNIANASGSGSGTYTLNVTYTVNGCTNTNAIAVATQTVKPIAAINSTPVITCANPIVTISGGPATGVSYNWSGGIIVGTNTNVSVNVSTAGVYSLAVTSTSNGCTSTTPATVNITANTSSPSISIGANQVIPCSPASVQVTSTVSPVTATLSWAGPNVCGGTNSSTATACAPGVYTLTATNPANGCFSMSTLTVNPNAGLNVSVANTGTVYCSPSTVQVIATSTPATNNTYAWTGPGIVSGNGTSTITVNQGGTYSVTVTNTISGCSFNFNNVVIANNTSITPNASGSNTVNCNNTTATIVTAPTPTAPAGSFIYNWSNSATTPTIVVNPTANTSYSVIITNTVNGCTGTAVYNVVANTVPPAGVSVSPNTFTLSCATPNTILTATAAGSPTYSWIAPAGTGSIVGSTTTASTTVSGYGSFTVIATDATNGCSAAAQMATIVQNTAQPSYSVSNSSPSITCLSSSPTISVSITSTVPISSYSWGPTSGIAGTNTTNVVTFTAAGVYTGIITATNGCQSTAIITVASATTAPSIVAGTGTAQTISCTNTIVTIAPTFTPSGNLTYVWSGPGIIGSATDASVQVNQNGSYSLTVTNSLTGCSSTSVTIPVVGTSVPPTLNVTSSSSIGISCQPNTNTVTITANSPASVTYSWNTGATTAGITTGNAGVYTVTITDNNSNCTATQTIAIANNTITPSLSASASGNLPCGASGTTTLNAITSNTNAVYNWSGPSVTNGSGTANAQVAAAGVYTVTVTDNITGCISTQTVAVNSTSVQAQFTPDATTGVAPLTVNFNNQSTGASTYSWDFGNGTSTQTNPSNTFPAGTYTVELVALNGACSSTADVVIMVKQALGSIPQVFTPNGDGHNDLFEIKGLDSYPNNSLQIFNRWGNEVFKAKPYNNDWDGSPNASGKTGSSKLPTGTYFFILDLGDDAKTVFKEYIQLQY